MNVPLENVQREPFNVRCAGCEHVWTAAYTPLPIETFGKLLKGLCCPMCGGDSTKIFLAKKEPA